MDVSNDRERTPKLYEQYGYTIPAAYDVGQEVAGSRYGVFATPTNYLLDARGRIVWRHYGYRRGDEADLRAEIRKVLDEAPIASGSTASGE